MVFFYCDLLFLGRIDDCWVVVIFRGFFCIGVYGCCSENGRSCSTVYDKVEKDVKSIVTSILLWRKSWTI